MSETLQNEIRSTRPAASAALRERVRALAAQEPAREPFLARFQWRSLLLVAPATLVVAVAAAGVIGLTRDNAPGRGEQSASGGSEGAATIESAAGAPVATVPAFEAASPTRRALQPWALQPQVATKRLDTGTPVAPAPDRLQRYEAELRLRVDDVASLSDATKRAQQIAANQGGSVASLQYDAPSQGVGAAQITLRIPTARVQAALAELSRLGTILGQRYGIQDLQQQADSLQTQIEQTQRRIAQILTQLESPTLSDETRVVLQSRLNASRQKLTGLREAMRATNAEARTATIYLTLTTEEIQPGAVGGSRLDDVKDVLAWEGIALLYFLVVAGPFILLGLLTWLAFRHRHRREEARLLAK